MTIKEMLQDTNPVALLVYMRMDRDIDRAVYKGCEECRKRECECNKGQRYYYKISVVCQDNTGAYRSTLFDRQA